MSSPGTFFLLEPFHTVPITEPHQWLGRVVKNFAVPLEAWTPEQPSIAPETIIDDPGFTNVQAVVHNARSGAAEAIFKGLFGYSDDSSTSQDPHFTAHKVRRIRLSKDQECFTRLLEDTSVRMKIMSWLGIRKPVYFIVGYLTTDAIQFKDGKSTSSSTKVTVTAPLKPAAAAFGVPLFGKEPLSVSSSKSVADTSHIVANARGSRIFAIEYKVVRRRLTSIKNPLEIRDHGLVGSRMLDSTGKMALDGNENANRAVEVVLDEDPISELEDVEDQCFSL